jgi:hypothetical protein
MGVSVPATPGRASHALERFEAARHADGTQ